MELLRIPARFNGPPASGNGGWSAGLVAGLLPDAPAVTVRLQSPPPLDTDLRSESGGDGSVLVLAGEVPVATVRASDRLASPVPEPVDHATALAAGGAYEGLDDHPFPTCFSCGTGRTDGLGLRPGRVAGREDGAYAAAWTPVEVSSEVVWAAIDCPGGWSAGIAGRPMVLGTMTAQVDVLPTLGEPHVVLAWPMGGQGRRFHSGTALLDATGAVLARAEATWIAVDPTSIRPKESA
jgi:hypothetical protein